MNSFGNKALSTDLDGLNFMSKFEIQSGSYNDLHSRLMTRPRVLYFISQRKVFKWSHCGGKWCYKVLVQDQHDSTKTIFFKGKQKKKEKPPTPSSGRFSKWMLETTGNYSVIIDLNGMGLRSRSRRRDAPVHVEKFEAALHAIYWSFC